MRLELTIEDLHALARSETYDTPEFGETKALMDVTLDQERRSSDYLAGLASAFYSAAEFLRFEGERFAEQQGTLYPLADLYLLLTVVTARHWSAVRAMEAAAEGSRTKTQADVH